jgi:hypothetical protein
MESKHQIAHGSTDPGPTLTTYALPKTDSFTTEAISPSSTYTSPTTSFLLSATAPEFQPTKTPSNLSTKAQSFNLDYTIFPSLLTTASLFKLPSRSLQTHSTAVSRKSDEKSTSIKTPTIAFITKNCRHSTSKKSPINLITSAKKDSVISISSTLTTAITKTSIISNRTPSEVSTGTTNVSVISIPSKLTTATTKDLTISKRIPSTISTATTKDSVISIQTPSKIITKVTNDSLISNQTSINLIATTKIGSNVQNKLQGKKSQQ